MGTARHRAGVRQTGADQVACSGCARLGEIVLVTRVTWCAYRAWCPGCAEGVRGGSVRWDLSAPFSGSWSELRSELDLPSRTGAA
jgi:hypothetical protein